jgi:hypothetical protein
VAWPILHWPSSRPGESWSAKILGDPNPAQRQKHSPGAATGSRFELHARLWVDLRHPYSTGTYCRQGGRRRRSSTGIDVEQVRNGVTITLSYLFWRDRDVCKLGAPGHKMLIQLSMGTVCLIGVCKLRTAQGSRAFSWPADQRSLLRKNIHFVTGAEPGRIWMLVGGEPGIVKQYSRRRSRRKLDPFGEGSINSTQNMTTWLR